MTRYLQGPEKTENKWEALCSESDAEDKIR